MKWFNQIIQVLMNNARFKREINLTSANIGVFNLQDIICAWKVLSHCPGGIYDDSF